MQEISTQLVTLLQTLLPGFVTSIIFYWLATAPCNQGRQPKTHPYRQ